jgi:WD40 repeat protein
MKNTVLAAAFFACLSNASAQAPPSYAKDVRPFLAKYCLECHNAKALKGGLNLETYKGIQEGADKGPVLSAGKPAESLLVTSVEGKTKPAMPPKTAKFHPKAEEIALVRAWVQSGAKNDSELIKVTIPDIKPRRAAQAPVTGVAYDPGAPMLAIGKYKLLQLIDLKYGMITDHPQPGNITALTFGARESSLAVAIGSPGESASVLMLGPAASLKRTFSNLHKDVILDVALSPDGKLLASCSYDTQIKITSLETPQSPSLARTLKDHSDAVYGIAFSPDGKRLASCSADRAVKVWDTESGKLLYTLSDATDWLYAIAWSPDGKRLAAGGVDKSIRVYEPGLAGAKILRSVFAHEAPVQKIVFSRDGKTLYSLGQDRVLKAWDTERMVETKTYDRLRETGLCLAVRAGEIAVGRYDGVTQVLNSATGNVLHELGGGASKTLSIETFPAAIGHEGNQSPGTGQLLKLPAAVLGKLSKAGDFNFFRFEVSKGQQLGVQVLTTTIGSKVVPYLQLTDQHGRILEESTEGHLGHTFADAGVYALGIRDQEFRGGPDMHYRLRLGAIPVVTSLFPLGLQRGTEGDIHVQGVFLSTDKVHLRIPASAEPGAKIPVPVSSAQGKPLGRLEVVAGEFPERLAQAAPTPPALAGTVVVPGTANGRLLRPGQDETWKFTARKGQRLIVETSARRLGSALDSILEVLDSNGNAVPRAVLRCQAKTYVTFRDHDSSSPNIRIEAWGELGVNDMIYVGGDLMKIRELPTHPDADCSFFSASGQRRGYLDTTPTHHSMNEPMYKVTQHLPGTVFPPNGYPVFTLYYRNDDGGPGYGRDSRIFFDPPADGDYLIRVRDARGQGGERFGYRLSVRAPRPSFNVRFNPTNPVVPRGGAVSIHVAADRLDGYEGPINIHLENLPAGFSAPPTTIEAGQAGTDLAVYADENAKASPGAAPLRLIAEATICGEKVRKQVVGEALKTKDPGEVIAFSEESDITVRPGHQVKLTVHIERRQGFLGRVPLEVRGLPHGVRVLDIGLNGILVNENEVRRTIVIYAEPWVETLSHPLVLIARREGKNTEHAAKAVTLHVGKE